MTGNFPAVIWLIILTHKWPKSIMAGKTLQYSKYIYIALYCL